MSLLLSLMASWATPALAQTPADLEVVVVSDPYRRWDDTRWRVDHQITLPYPAVLYAENNLELHMVAYDARLVMACELSDPLTRRSREVSCLVEDAAISVAPWYRKNPDAQAVLDETDQRLTGLEVVLHVGDDGRILNVGLVGEPQGERRLNVQYENLRQIVKRALVGFHLKAGGQYTVGEQWHEKNSELLTLPSFQRVPLPIAGVFGQSDGSFGAASLQALDASSAVSSTSQFRNPNGTEASKLGVPFLDLSPNVSYTAFQAPASYGFSVTAHRMDAYRGRYLVQSHGEGTADLGTEVPITFTGVLDAVSVYERSDGVMTERVWTVEMQPTAGSIFAAGPAGWPYRHVGNLKMLGADEDSEVGRSTLVSPPGGLAKGFLPPWPSL